MTSDIKAVLFDKDGTLLDFDTTWGPVQRAAARYAAPDDPEIQNRLLKAAGMDPVTGQTAGGSLFAAGNTMEIAETWTNLGVIHDQEKLAREMDRLFTEGMRQARLLPGLPETLKMLRNSGFRLGVASSDSEESIRTFLVATGCADSFEFIAGYDSGHGPKPQPGMINGFSAAIGLPASAIAMVGDNTHDLEMAVHADAGLKVGVLSGTGSHEALEPLADHILASAADLPSLFL